MESGHDSFHARHPILLKFRKNKIFLKLTMAERVKEVEFFDEDLIQVKCMTSGVLIRPKDVYHFTLILPLK